MKRQRMGVSETLLNLQYATHIMSQRSLHDWMNRDTKIFLSIKFFGKRDMNIYWSVLSCKNRDRFGCFRLAKYQMGFSESGAPPENSLPSYSFNLYADIIVPAGHCKNGLRALTLRDHTIPGRQAKGLDRDVHYKCEHKGLPPPPPVRVAGW